MRNKIYTVCCLWYVKVKTDTFIFIITNVKAKKATACKELL